MRNKKEEKRGISFEQSTYVRIKIHFIIHIRRIQVALMKNVNKSGNIKTICKILV